MTATRIETTLKPRRNKPAAVTAAGNKQKSKQSRQKEQKRTTTNLEGKNARLQGTLGPSWPCGRVYIIYALPFFIFVQLTSLTTLTTNGLCFGLVWIVPVYEFYMHPHQHRRTMKNRGRAKDLAKVRTTSFSSIACKPWTSSQLTASTHLGQTK